MNMSGDNASGNDMLGDTGDEMRRRLFIIANPRTGRGKRAMLLETCRFLHEAGAKVEMAITARRGEGAKLAARAVESGLFDAVIAAGGDGTAHDVAQGLIGSEVPLGIVPLGTANVLAREIGMKPAPDALAETLLFGPARTIRPGVANGQPFLFVVGIGFDAAAVRHFEAGGYRRMGLGGLAPPVLRALAEGTDWPLAVEIDGTRQEAHWLIVTRVPRYAANILLCEEASLFSDTLCAVLFRGGRAARLRQLAAMLAGLVRHEPSISIHRARQLHVTGPAATPVQIDGESAGRLPLLLTIGEENLRLIFPPARVRRK